MITEDCVAMNYKTALQYLNGIRNSRGSRPQIGVLANFKYLAFFCFTEH